MTEQMTEQNTQFDMNKYQELIDTKIHDIYSRPVSEKLSYDILDTPESIQKRLSALQETQRRMKNGEIWQAVLGNYNGFRDLRIGHPTGLDILSDDRKIIIELKNRTNTDNSSSKKTKFDQLAAYKTEHPEYTCIYANVNEDTEEKTLTGFVKKIIHNDVEIEHQTGYAFLKFILGDDMDFIIQFVKSTIAKYST